jgi:hypothetical protein
MSRTTLLVTAVLALGAATVVSGQARGAQGRGAAPPAAKPAAPIDLTGYWVSYVNKDWRWRMVTAPKGDFVSIPLNAEGQKVGQAWDPAKDEAAGEQCRSFGVAGLMRIPGRLHITWQDDNTLKVETDAGTQTRLLRFGGVTPSPRPTWQGDSAAQWVGTGPPARGGESAGPKFGSLEVITRNMRPGYLRTNGVPYSGGAVLTEYWDLYREPGTDWLVISTTVEDPTYLQIPYQTSPAFKREPDGSKWDPSPCTARW